MRYIILLFFFMTGSLGGTEAQAQENSNFSWPEGKVAAVCLTYDDGLDCHLDVAVPALDKHGLKGTFYCSGFSSSLNQRIDEWRKIAGDGHELGNHTLFHPCDGEKFDWVKPEYDLNSYSLDQLMIELRTANTLLEAVDGKKVRSFAYTCADNSIDGVSFMDSIPTLFPSARGEGPIPESMRDVDLFYAPSWGVIDPSGEDLIAYVEDAWAKGTMAVFMFHSVGGGYLNVSEEAHTILLEYLERNKDDLWTDTFLNVMNHVIKEQ